MVIRDGWMDGFSAYYIPAGIFQKIVRTLLNVKKILLNYVFVYRDYFFTNLSLRIKLENFE